VLPNDLFAGLNIILQAGYIFFGVFNFKLNVTLLFLEVTSLSRRILTRFCQNRFCFQNTPESLKICVTPRRVSGHGEQSGALPQNFSSASPKPTEEFCDN